MFTSSFAVVTAALLSSVGIVNAGCQNDAVCQQLGCTDNAQVVFGVTEIKEPRTTVPPYDLAGFPGATAVGAQNVGGSTLLVTWRASEPTTFVVPKSTAAKDGQPGTTYFIATSTFEYNGVKYEKPHVTSTTSTSYTKTETSTTTVTTTATSTTTSIPPPVTNWSTTISTTTKTQWSTTTQTETTTTTVVPDCPTIAPLPPCQNRNFQGWTNIAARWDGAVIQPATISVNTEAPSWITLTNIKLKNAKFLVKVDGQPLGQTSDFAPDRTKYITDPQQAINAGYSWGTFPLPAGQHTVSVSAVNPDTGYSTFDASYKLDERC